MPRRLRCLLNTRSETTSLVEITTRTVQARYLMSPDREGDLREIVLGVLGHAQRRSQVTLHAVSCLSNHYHLLASFRDAQQMGDFMNFVNGQLGKEIARYADWPDKVWSRRYQAIEVSDEPDTQIARLRYVLSHGVKEHLVERAEQWPGVQSVSALRDGEPLQGLWFDRTQEGEAQRRKQSFSREQYATEEIVELTPLPCMKHLSPTEHREWIARLVEDIEEEARQERKPTEDNQAGLKVVGLEEIYAQDRQYRPDEAKSSPAPDFHAVHEEVYKALREGYAWVVQTFRAAADRLRKGDRSVEFPEGTFPPGLPFVSLARGHPF